MADVGFPVAPVFDFVFFGDGVSESDFGVAVEAKVGLFVVEGGAVGVRRDVAVPLFKSLSGVLDWGSGRERAGEG